MRHIWNELPRTFPDDGETVLVRRTPWADPPFPAIYDAATRSFLPQLDPPPPAYPAQCRSLSGTQYLDAGAIGMLPLRNTLAFWERHAWNKTVTDTHAFLFWGTTPGSLTIEQSGPSGIAAGTYYGGWYANLIPTTAYDLPTNTWNLWTLSTDPRPAGGAILTLNDQRWQTTTPPPPNVTGFTWAAIGLLSQISLLYPINADLCELAIWDEVLSTAERAALQTADAPTVRQANLRNYFPLGGPNYPADDNDHQGTADLVPHNSPTWSDGHPALIHNPSNIALAIPWNELSTWRTN